MADIARSHDVPVSLPLLADGRQMQPPDEKNQGPAGFWVAAIESKAGEHNIHKSEVVGYLGLGQPIYILVLNAD
jgi:hypothetical protein